ncbi:galactose-1-epimerase [Vibrio salinus]|uniref:galactose-1-epimerase n=1 Tax=Vibrio salinus TaxID=2899784 RepID=UPI001E533594|nr:galactose-1-epimerase [Vibrio salinus]MCE0493654.1 galactose-1-epimerase [Vibrio salinus]
MTDSLYETLNNTMGQTPSYDDKPAQLVHLRNDKGMTVTLMDIGATWLSCSVPVKSGQREVLLRAGNMKEHVRQTAFLGAIVGRFANRLKSGRFTIGSDTFQVSTNEGENTLHGGRKGFDKRRWTIINPSEREVTFSLKSADGDQGFPGNLSASVRYFLTDDNRLEIHYQADVDKTCPVNLTNHAYFNLSGIDNLQSCLDHSMQMDAPYYLPTEKDMLPTGECKPTQGTVFDFAKRKRIGEHFLEDEDQMTASGFDHAFILNETKTDGQRAVVSLMSPDGDLEMQIRTTKPAIQVYSGNFLQGVIGTKGEYANHAGIALETQYLPDGPNHSEWKGMTGVISAGEPYRHLTSYTFITRAL